jgi:DNA-binding response OmpR family regulator
MRILVIEDNRDLAANLSEFLESFGHVVDVARDGMGGMYLALANDYDAIVLDLMLPGMDGLTLCRKLREEPGPGVPVLMLTARDSLDDKLAGLEAGADDYVVKPFAMKEVEARLRTIVRRTQPQGHSQKLIVADLVFDRVTWRISRGGRVIALPPICQKLLEHLMRASPRVVSREELETAVWGDTPPDCDALKTHLHLLRSLVDKPFDIPLLRTVRGVGYQIAAPDAAS